MTLRTGGAYGQLGRRAGHDKVGGNSEPPALLSSIGSLVGAGGTAAYGQASLMTRIAGAIAPDAAHLRLELTCADQITGQNGVARRPFDTARAGRLAVGEAKAGTGLRLGLGILPPACPQSAGPHWRACRWAALPPRRVTATGGVGGHHSCAVSGARRPRTQHHARAEPWAGLCVLRWVGRGTTYNRAKMRRDGAAALLGMAD